MSPALTTTDLLPTDVYALVRPGYRGRILELKRKRRVSVGRHISVVFESRETVLYQIQEILWAERPSNPARISEEIAEYERLIPKIYELTATLMIHSGSPSAGQALMKNLVAGAPAVFLKLDGRTIAAEALSPFCDVTCPVQYLRFPLDDGAADALVDRRAGILLGVVHAGDIEIVPLPAETIAELATDLEANRASDPSPNSTLLPRTNPL